MKVLEPELEKAFKEKLLNYSNEISLWTSVLGLDGTRYGSYKRLSRKDLENREYNIEHIDGLSLFFTDALHVPTDTGWKTVLKKDFLKFVLTN